MQKLFNRLASRFRRTTNQQDEAQIGLDPRIPGRPLIIGADIVDACNLSCPFCFVDRRVKTAATLMDEITFSRMLQFLPYVRDEDGFWLSCAHEPTMHPQLSHFISLIPEEYRGRCMMTTNLCKLKLSGEIIDAIANSGFGHVNVSLDSLVPETFETLRRGASHEVFKRNLDSLANAIIRRQGKTRLKFITLVFNENIRELDAIVDFARNGLGLGGVVIEMRDAFRCQFDNPWLEKNVASSEDMQEVERLFSSPPEVNVKMHTRLAHCIDHASTDMIYGWVQDWSLLNHRLHVSLRSKSTGEVIAEKTADQFRQDLLDAGIGDGKHGFILEIPKDFPFQDAQVVCQNTVLFENNDQHSACADQGGPILVFATANGILHREGAHASLPNMSEITDFNEFYTKLAHP